MLSTSFCAYHCQAGVQGRFFSLLEDMDHCCLGDQAGRKCARCDIDGTGVHEVHRLLHEHLRTQTHKRARTQYYFDQDMIDANNKNEKASIRMYYGRLSHLPKIVKI